MNKQAPLKEIVTVTEMARMCRLSRARFYQLVKEGIFPNPSRNKQTKRPFFDKSQQEQCLLVRRINKGANGKCVIFYGCRLESPPPPKRNRKQLPISKLPKARHDPILAELRHGLAQLGIANANDADLRNALTRAYPDGHREVEKSELLMAVFGELQRRNTADKLSG